MFTVESLKKHFECPPKDQDLTTLPSRSAFLLTNYDGLPESLAHDKEGWSLIVRRQM